MKPQEREQYTPAPLIGKYILFSISIFVRAHFYPLRTNEKWKRGNKANKGINMALRKFIKWKISSKIRIIRGDVFFDNYLRQERKAEKYSKENILTWISDIYSRRFCVNFACETIEKGVTYQTRGNFFYYFLSSCSVSYICISRNIYRRVTSLVFFFHCFTPDIQMPEWIFETSMSHAYETGFLQLKACRIFFNFFYYEKFSRFVGIVSYEIVQSQIKKNFH